MKMQGNYWVYTHTCPNGMVYVGMSSQKDTNRRWQPSAYRKTSLEPYIKEYGWENIDHFFIDGIETKESALKLEGDLIDMYKAMGCCINERDSGYITLDIKEYNIKNKERKKEYDRERYLKHKKQNQ